MTKEELNQPESDQDFYVLVFTGGSFYIFRNYLRNILE
ncbi:hypothetical protein LEP1GSC103_1167 [Leptospira borgpetersenii serovar Javanica str. UI 09931]|uniref:Uncharacterized protein n=5 Tax=Leptospira borgpetersenii TaxID=174 RepID=M3FJ02_LEPBO|nr:hypothetical protein LBBP_02721 [Leptospira borgpetersenii serovar Ballum]EKP15189.1 hypothetical protein LEP1GSC128_2229 [Leptospira borgpetersenii str. 200801926]EKQ90154.1 hypothetical protein LEP1GSC101_2057 [Leptospira borgpetersenii str. UI 09149]EKQ99245.1 hypothetical protein LEP1GSC121_2701 [Leptospira borgpetersenii serovar Castellonis str. 200801910]EMG01803.1 hypothetical protein LEP1GSC123_0354 [Leptospira borgpetersenii str. 200701203]EMK12698.1 hypothetical protein LEP1GSC066